MFLKKGFLFFAALAFLVFMGQASAGPNESAMLSLDLIVDGGAGNQTDDGVTSGTVSGQGTTIAVEVFATGVTTPLVGFVVQFDFDASLLTFSKAENSAFAFTIPEPTGTNFAATSPVTLDASGFLARAEFTTAADVTGQEFSLGIKSVTLSESSTSSDEIMTTSAIMFNVQPKVMSDAGGSVIIPREGSVSTTVTVANFAPDATITFTVEPEGAVELMQDGTTLTLTASGTEVIDVSVTASDGTTTTAPVAIQFVPFHLAAIPALDIDDSGNGMNNGNTSGTAVAGDNIVVEVFAGELSGAIGGANITFSIDPPTAAAPTGGASVDGLTVLGVAGGTVSFGASAAEGVTLGTNGYLGTVAFTAGPDVAADTEFTISVTDFTVLLASGDTPMPSVEPLMFNVQPKLTSDVGELVTIPRGGSATAVITAAGFAGDVAFTVGDPEGAATVESASDGATVTLTASGFGSAVVMVTATDGTATREITIQFDEQVAVELSAFVGEVVEDRVVLNWETASQTNNAGFRVLRSTDQETYEVVSDLIAGAGTTDQLMDYTFEDASLPAVEKVYYVLEQIDIDGTVQRSNPIEVLLGARFLDLPTEFSSAVYPNPFNPSTTISYNLPADADVSIVIYDAIGQEIRQLMSERHTAGRYSIPWDAKDHLGRSVGSGVYIAKIKAGQNTAIQKMLLLK